MDLSVLPVGELRDAVDFPHFPEPFLAVIWRNWGIVPFANLARTLRCSRRELFECAELLGLPLDISINPEWMKKGYLTVIRNNWHLLDYEQLLELIGWSPERLAFSLKEEDFLFGKLGKHKPVCRKLYYTPLSPETKGKLKFLRQSIAKHFPDREFTRQERAFAFTKKYSGVPGNSGGRKKDSRFEFNFIHSYAASCGDIFADIETNDPIPENLLIRYAEMGIKGVWVHAVLYTLCPIPGAEKFSAGWENRMKNLALLVERCKKYGIGVYLYLNEPRGMSEEFYQEFPEWRGVKKSVYTAYSNCISRTPAVLEWLEYACKTVFGKIPDIAGAFLISMSENPTHCDFEGRKEECPCCRDLRRADLISQVAAAVERGIHASAPKARVMVNDWAWGKPEHGIDDPVVIKKSILDRMPENVWYMSVSEWGLKINAGGVPGKVSDYSISKVGPGDEAREMFRYAAAKGFKTIAKIQANNSWEISAVPWLSVPHLVREHIDNLYDIGVKALMLSWTLGGYPGGNLLLLDKTVEEYTALYFNARAVPGICRAYKLFSDAFREYPFSIMTVYRGPMNYGPRALFYPEKTGRTASTIGFPFDDLETWRSIYPPEIFRQQFEKLVKGWKKGLLALEKCSGSIAGRKAENFYRELYDFASVQYIHFSSTLEQIKFIMARDARDFKAARKAVRAEIKNAVKLHGIVRRDSRIGFEASNHYYYSLNDLREKVINCEWILKNKFK